MGVKDFRGIKKLPLICPLIKMVQYVIILPKIHWSCGMGRPHSKHLGLHYLFIFSEHFSLCARNYSKCFPSVSLFNPHKDFVSSHAPLPTLQIEKVRYTDVKSSKVMQLGSSRGRIRIQAVWFQQSCSWPVPYHLSLCGHTLAWQFIHKDIQDSLPGDGVGQTVAVLVFRTLIICQWLYRKTTGTAPLNFQGCSREMDIGLWVLFLLGSATCWEVAFCSPWTWKLISPESKVPVVAGCYLWLRGEALDQEGCSASLSHSPKSFAGIKIIFWSNLSD